MSQESSGVMTGDHQDAQCDETAAQYGRYEGCFVDHHAAPFTLHHVLPLLQPPDHPAESLLISEQGLCLPNLPQPTIQLDAVTYHDNSLQTLLSTQVDGPVTLPLLWHPLHTLKEMKVPLSEIDVGSELRTDVEAYQNDLALWKKHFDITKTWLPLSRVDTESDEGLEFPTSCERMRLLLIRELERETVAQSNTLHELLGGTAGGECGAQPAYPSSDLNNPHCFRPQWMTPPLSPISECADPFVPDRDVCVIDLTSEPDSPTNLSDSRHALQAKDDQQSHTDNVLALLHDDKQPGAPSFTRQLDRAHDWRLEVPLLLESSDDPSEVEITQTCGFGSAEPATSPDISDGFTLFEGKLDAELESTRAKVRRMTDHENLDTIGCSLRLPVVAMDFRIAAPEWSTHIASPNRLHGFLHACLGDYLQLKPVRLVESDFSTLKWCPIPLNASTVGLHEDPVPVNSNGKRFLSIDAAPRPISGLRLFESLMCFQSIREDGEDLALADDSENRTRAPYVESRFFASSSEPPESDKAGKDSSARTETTSFTKGSCTTLQESQIPTKIIRLPLSPAWPPKAKRKLQHDSLFGALRDVGTGEATSNLLGAFMHLRGQKRSRRQNRESGPATVKTTIKPTAATEDQSTTMNPLPAALPAPWPEIRVPAERGCFIISLSLGRAVLKHLDAYWPRDLLIDRDYDRHKSTAWSIGSAQPQEVVPVLCHDADVALTPEVGIIVTSLLKATQKPLPGSQSSTPLRQQIGHICGKYETVVVLVSEKNAAGEYTSLLGPSDTTAYADFVRFTTSLPNDCVCVFVPGASETLAKWITSLMCKYSTQALAFRDLLSPTEMSWEVFLRRAGMNMMAAQVLAGRLLQYGPGGLSKFLAMSTQEKLNEFGALVGKRALVRVSQALDRRWT